MRALTILLVLVSIVFTRCKNKELSNNLIGTFTNQSKSDYSVASDTLIITPLDKAENIYQIERRTGYQKIRHVFFQSKEYKVEKWRSLWNKDKLVLSETDYGRQITPGKDSQSLTLKNTQYQKIK